MLYSITENVHAVAPSPTKLSLYILDKPCAARQGLRDVGVAALYHLIFFTLIGFTQCIGVSQEGARGA